MLELLLLPPIMRGFVTLLFAGLSFPLAGVMVIRLNLMQLRYTLMHGLLLGGALALALELPTLPVYILMCILTVVLVLAMGKGGRMSLGISASFLMVVSVALAALISQVADVPSKDTLELLWGSPFTVRAAELAVFILLSLGIVLYTVLDRRAIMQIFFDRDVAIASGRNVIVHENLMVFLIAFAVALSMRFVGALLIDALLILPAVIAMKRSRSIKGLFVSASLAGLATAVVGFALSLAFDMPPSSKIALSSAILYLLIPRRKSD